MPVHLAFDRHRASLDPASATVLLLGREELDRLLLDSKGVGVVGRGQHSPSSVFHQVEPVCCCERCYAFLANPVIAKLASSSSIGAEDGRPWNCDEASALSAAADSASDWLSLCPWTTAACDCDRRRLADKEDCSRRSSGELKDRSDEASLDSTPPVLKKRMTTDKTASDGDSSSFITGTRRPLVDLQRGANARHPPGPPVSGPDAAAAFHPAAGRRGLTGGWWPGRDESRSWVQPPPNRTICHIVDDLTLERLTAAAASSPVMTRCCVASSAAAAAAAARKQGTGRNVGGKAKARNQYMAR